MSFQSLTGAFSWLNEEHAKVILNNETGVKAQLHTNITSFSPDLSLTAHKKNNELLSLGKTASRMACVCRNPHGMMVANIVTNYKTQDLSIPSSPCGCV